MMNKGLNDTLHMLDDLKLRNLHLFKDTLLLDAIHEIFRYSRLSLCRIPRDSLKYFEISVPRHIRFAEFRKK